MKLYCYSIAHNKSNLELREKLALNEHDSVILSDILLASGLNEALTLCTCNRTEIFAVSKEREIPDFAGFLADITTATRELIAEAGILYQDQQVIEHLFMLACGLKSMVVGETEILGQLKRSYANALAVNSTGKILNRSFQHAFTLAKHIRSGTEIGKFRISVASIAVEEIVKLRSNVDTLNIYVWGTGEVGRATVKALEASGAKPGIVLSRHPERFQSNPLAPGWVTINSTSHAEVISDADIFISCTGAPHTVITAKHLKQVYKPLLLVDLAVPRDIAPEVRELGNVTLIDMDDIGKISQENISRRENTREQLTPILKNEATKYFGCLVASDSQSCIAKWRQEAHEILAQEIDTLLAETNDLPEEFREKFNKLGRRLMHRMLHWPSVALNRAIRSNLPCADYFKELESEIELEFSREEIYGITDNREDEKDPADSDD